MVKALPFLLIAIALLASSCGKSEKDRIIDLNDMAVSGIGECSARLREYFSQFNSGAKAPKLKESSDKLASCAEEHLSRLDKLIFPERASSLKEAAAAVFSFYQQATAESLPEITAIAEKEAVGNMNAGDLIQANEMFARVIAREQQLLAAFEESQQLLATQENIPLGKDQSSTE